MHFNLNFIADDTVTTVITNFNGTAVTDNTTDTAVLTLLAPGGFVDAGNDNLFDPTTLATAGGWNGNGIGFQNTVPGDKFDVYYNQGLSLYSSMNVSDTFNNFSYSSSAVSSVPVPAAVWLFASGLGLLTFGRRKKITN